MKLCALLQGGIDEIGPQAAYAPCKLGGIVGGDEGPIGEVAQVVCHGVKVVGAHGEVGREEDGEVQGEV